MKKSRYARACDFTPAVKQSIYERDGGLCVLCGRPGAPNAHYISRAQGGLGVEENGLTLCHACHMRYDQTEARAMLRVVFRKYLSGKYQGWNEENLVYKKHKTYLQSK